MNDLHKNQKSLPKFPGDSDCAVPVTGRTIRNTLAGLVRHTPGASAVCAAVLIAVSLATAPLTVEASDTYYRWKDAQGKLVVSDRPPADDQIEYEVVSQRSSLVRRVRPGEGAVPPEVNPRPGNEFESVDTRREELAEVPKNPENCERAKTNLETLNTSVRIRIRDAESGELRFLTDEEKETQRDKAREVIRVHCE